MRPVFAPEGMRDRLFSECSRRRERETALAALFQSRGFREVSTPVLEHYGLFTRTGSPLPEEEMVKVLDRSGRICVLRPDNTAPIARLAATRLQNEPLPIKLWYTQPVYRADSVRGCFELPQTGAEAIGSAGDAEMVSLALEATEAVFYKKPHIEVSHAGVLKPLCERLPAELNILPVISRKNFAALGDELPDCSAARDLMKLMRLSGGAEAIEEALRTLETPPIQPLEDLRMLLNGLPEGAVTIDFSLAPAVGYYTGIFFRGYVEGAAGAVLTGGRYDSLLRDIPAIGFAIEIE